MDAIEKHGRELLAIFPGATETDPVALYKKLRRIERKVDARNVRQCNQADIDEREWGQIGDDCLDAVDALLRWREAGVPVVLEGDPRGYALKIDCEWIGEHRVRLIRDWGGYGILAPEIDSE